MLELDVFFTRELKIKK